MTALSMARRFCARTVLFVAVSLALAIGISAQEFVPGEVIVVFDSKIPNDHKQAAHQAHGHKSIKQLRGINAQVVKINGKKSVPEAVADYRRDPRVLLAEPNYVAHAFAAANDVYFSSLWAIQNTGQ